jgi:hypothetical protein
MVWHKLITRGYAHSRDGISDDTSQTRGRFGISSLTWLTLDHVGLLERSGFRAALDCLRQILLSGRSGKFVLDDVIPLLSSS